MKNRPIHENLDTSFVNLSALIKYLRRRQFVGQVRIELSGYEADIYLTAENHLKAREYDHIAGRVAEGEQALQRILIRSREPGGIINVYQTLSEAEAVEKKEIIERKDPPAPVFENKPLIAKPNGANGKPKIEIPLKEQISNGQSEPSKTAEEEKPLPPKGIFPNVPFEFSNKVEERAKPPAFSAQDRETLLNLMGELLGTIDRSLGMAKLDFPSAFQKACAEIAADYPFLKTLDYGKGKIYYAEANTNPKFFVAGILEALRRILDKLAQNAKFAEVHRYAAQRILGLIHQRRALYDRFSITKQLEKILGV